jgi:hypothetical protein
MNRPDSEENLGRRAAARATPVHTPRYGRYVGFLAVLILLVLTIVVAVTKHNGAKGVAPGAVIPPFAAPLASGTVNGDVNVATHANDGPAGKTPACAVRGAGILNVCELYGRGPLVLALFVDAGSCQAILGDMQRLAGEFPAVSFAAVAIKGERGALRRIILARGLTRVELGFDRDGVLAGLYKMASCPQVTFVLPGGVVQGPAILSRPPLLRLRARVSELAAAARARGWRAPR